VTVIPVVFLAVGEGPVLWNYLVLSLNVKLILLGKLLVGSPYYYSEEVQLYKYINVNKNEM